jgi:hypothetical protein
MLHLNDREAKLGTSINSRAEMHGDQEVPAFDIPLSGIPLEESELNTLLQDESATESLYIPPNGNGRTMTEPRFKGLAPLKLKDKIENAEVLIWIGMAKEPLTLHACNLAKVTLEPKTGGTTLMSCQVQCTPTIDKSVMRLFDHLGSDVNVQIVVDGFGEQKDLLDEQPEADA